MPQDLPRWPIVFFGLSFPVLWLAGLGFAYLPLSGALAVVVLVRRHHAVLPPAWYLWFGYLVLVLASVVQIDTIGRLSGYLLRVGMLLGASALALYVYSATPRSVGVPVVYRSLAWLWAFLVVGGWLGLVFPEVVLHTPFASVVPGPLMSNELVNSLVQPPLAQIEYPYGEDPVIRPAAPLPAANGWGCNVALLAPVMVRYFTMVSGWRRIGVAGIGLLAVIPAAATLNRGLFVGLGVALGYVGLRAVFAGRLVTAAAVIGVLLGAFALASLAGVTASVSDRLDSSGTNDTRTSLYDEAVARTAESPLLGYGAPRPSLRQEISVGTQGHVWNVMISHGFVALALFIAYFLVSTWQGRQARAPADAAHVTTVVGCVLLWFYGFDGPQLAVLLLAGVVAVRDVRTRPWPALSQPRCEVAA